MMHVIRCCIIIMLSQMEGISGACFIKSVFAKSDSSGIPGASIMKMHSASQVCQEFETDFIAGSRLIGEGVAM